MSEEEREKIKKIAKLRALLEKRVEEMQTELEGIKTLLGLIDETLLKESFKRPEVTKPAQIPQKQETPKPQPPPPTPQVKPQRKGIPLKTVTGDILAHIVTEKNQMQIVLAEDKNFDINTPPFTSFFVERVLAKMHEKDIEDAEKGKIDPDKTVSFDIKQDGNIIREITIKNLRYDRSRELKSSIRWTLEKMYERMKQQT